MTKKQIENTICINNEHKGLRLEQVMLKTGLKKPTIYAYMKKGVLPKPIKFGRVSVWIEAEIEKALELRMKARGV